MVDESLVFLSSELGVLKVRTTPGGVRSVGFAGRGWRRRRATNPIQRTCARQLDEYMEGKRKQFSVPLDLPGTPFQHIVWKELRRIPYGRTVTYGQLAKAVRRPEATRAVGAACAANPAPIIVPCHRVVASDGGLGGYRGGLWRKRWLLEHERTVGGRRKGR
jgi:methylated-DNA-[protein]-cysteine S-methyltransferase